MNNCFLHVMQNCSQHEKNAKVLTKFAMIFRRSLQDYSQNKKNKIQNVNNKLFSPMTYEVDE